MYFTFYICCVSNKHAQISNEVLYKCVHVHICGGGLPLHVYILLVRSGAYLSAIIGEAGVSWYWSGWCISLVLMLRNRSIIPVHHMYTAEWCARQVMCIPCCRELTSLKQQLSRDCWLVWPHHDSVFSCTCTYMLCTCTCMCMYTVINIIIHVSIIISRIDSGGGPQLL